ncbi:MAG: DUF4159 domain-containing protein [Acetobacteraceae bacterium]
MVAAAGHAAGAAVRSSARTPWWLLALRLAAAGLVIVGLAGPVLDAAAGLPGSGAVLLVVDDGWAAAPDWARRMQAAAGVLDRAERAGRSAALLTTARSEADQPPRPTPAMPVAELRTRLAALRPKPWPPDRRAAAEALSAATAGAVIYLADGVAAEGDAAFGQALAAVAPVTELRLEPDAVQLARPPWLESDRLIARVSSLAVPAEQRLAVLAQTGDGRTLARAEASVPAGATHVELPIQLPPEIRNGIARLVLEGPASAGSVILLDERWRRRPVGLLAAEQGADTPLIGPLFYARRALAPTSELREGTLAALLARPLSVLVLADVPLEGAEAAELARWVEAGGLLVRFAGPRMAEASGDPAHDDTLLPVRLLAGDRQLGGALSWSEPAGLTRFPTESPFTGLPIPAEVTVSRQVLAEPSAQLAARTWASLADGTPLVTAATRGAGRVVLFGVTGNADWSNLPLSGLFVDMLRRLVELSAGVAGTAGDALLPPVETLDGFGALSPPPQAAVGLTGPELEQPVVSPQHPPGIYGPESGRRALNVGAALPELAPEPAVPGASAGSLGGSSRERPVGPALLALAIGLLALDLLLSLGLRGLLRPRAAAGVLLAVLAAGPAQAQTQPRAQPQAQAQESAALATRLAYVVTGDAAVDQVSRSGLTGLSTYVNRRTAATLADPVAIVPGQDDLSFYPLLYWPLTADAAPSPQAIAALNEFTTKGGIVLIDTRNGGTGEGYAPGTDLALRRAAAGLAVPPLTPLTGDHVLARAFYLLHEFPGRFAGDTVWVQRDQDRANDSVSPVIIGGHDWAAAWAVDAAGRAPFATIPGGARQRTLAYRFGVNLVMYALTGNYKGDQVHVPAILERLGQ